MFAKNREEPLLRYLDQKRAPNPRKLRIFLAEKGPEVPTEAVPLNLVNRISGPSSGGKGTRNREEHEASKFGN